VSGNLPVPIPRTFSVSEVEVGAYLNSVRDALNFLVNVPAAFVTQSATQNLTSSTFTALTFDQSVFDSYGGHSNVTNNSRYTAQVAGWYIVFGCSCFAANTTGQRGAAVAKNGTRIQGAAGFIQTTSALSPAPASPPTIVFLAVGDYVEIQAYQNGANPLATASGADLDSSMTVVWIHA
jgi:hypothetical protein